MSKASQDGYRDHMAECLVKTGMEPEQARREAAKRYPVPGRTIREEATESPREDRARARRTR